MIKKTILFYGVLVCALSLLPCASAVAAGHYAVAVGGSNIYMVSQGTGLGAKLVNTTGAGASHDYVAVTTSGRYIYALDRSANVVDVYNTTGLGATPTMSYVKSVDLPSSVNTPTSIAMNSAGDIYVCGKGTAATDPYSTYSYIRESDLKDATREATAYGINIPMGSSQALTVVNDNVFVLYQDLTPLKPSGVPGIAQGAGTSSPSTSLFSSTSKFPMSITGNSAVGRVYVATRTSGTPGAGSILTYVPGSGQDTGGTILLDNFTPDGMLAFGTTTPYLAVTGRTSSGAQQIWKFNIDPATGKVSSSPASTYSFGEKDSALQHFLAASNTNDLLWVSNSNTILALDPTANWGLSSAVMEQFDVPGAVNGMAYFDETAVPEPASFLTLAAFGTGALAMWRRRFIS